MTLDEVTSILIEDYHKGKRVVRLHTGDPTIYSAIGEQISILKEKDIPFKVIPGVTAGLAAASSLGCELTIPGVSQTVIISRIAGRTPVPETEDISILSRIRASLILYLSISKIDKVVERLLSGYDVKTPVAVVKKATWPSERIIRGTLSNISKKVKEAGIKRHAVIVVGEALRGITDLQKQASKLYSRYFSHGFRKGIDFDKKVLRAFSKNEDKKNLTIIFLGEKGKRISEKIKKGLYKKCEKVDVISYEIFKKDITKFWEDSRALVFIASCGVVIRTISAQLKDKLQDPAVICIAESGKNVISLLSGHIGGANSLAIEISKILDAVPVITTSSDTSFKLPFDLWCKSQGLIPTNLRLLKDVQAKIRNGEKIKVFIEEILDVNDLPSELKKVKKKEEANVIISPFLNEIDRRLLVVPRLFCLGVGCHKGMEPRLLFERCLDFLDKNGIHLYSIKKVTTIDKKGDEPAIIELSRELLADLKIFKKEEINEVKGLEISKAAQRALGAIGVSEPSSILCSKGGNLLVKKFKYPDCTFAISLEKFSISTKITCYPKT